MLARDSLSSHPVQSEPELHQTRSQSVSQSSQSSQSSQEKPSLVSSDRVVCGGEIISVILGWFYKPPAPAGGAEIKPVNYGNNRH